MNEKPDSGRVWHRIVRYAMITAVVQTLLGIMLYSTMYGRGPLSLLFLIPMVNIAYLWLTQNAIRVELWPAAIAIGTFFMFLVILAIGETDHLLGKQVFESESKQKSHVTEGSSQAERGLIENLNLQQQKTKKDIDATKSLKYLEGKNLDKEERELLIRLAQLNAHIQIGLAWVFGSLGAALTSFIFGYQVDNGDLYLTIALWTVAFISIVNAFGWMQKVKGYSDELRKLQ